ncbi:GTP-binding protein [Streptomyces armeniacus]|uniref:GTP-binding protein n=1 Tax=Streptomyces armeniacus TaxID=83291 RepID=A0A345XP39_9ACTN|nr:GTP-binding protein [Streptomyces armeniacus]AXK33405.1 GTP-binding protein [Streptomyces armeniacus]
MTTRAIPVVVLAGFLGSGKTTLLNHLLRSSGGTRIGAVVNDFGSIEIDAMTVAGQADAMVSLGDGCLCCAVDTSDLDEVLETLARPSARMDVIVVEASGLAEPETLIRMILGSGNPHIVYGGLVEVVDAAEFTRTRARHPELDRHAGIADLVVLNKADRVAEGDAAGLLATLSRLAPGTPVVTAAYGRVDPELLFDRPRRERPAVEQLSFDQLVRDEHEAREAERACADGDGHGGHLHAAYESVEFTSDEPMDPRRLTAFLDARPDGLYRIKGFVDFGPGDPERKYAVHAVGGFLRFQPLPWGRTEPRRTQLVLIGAGVDADSLRDALAAARSDPRREPGPERRDPDPYGMWGVLRYVDDPAERDEDPQIDEVEGPEEAEAPDPYETAGPYGTEEPYDPLLTR